MLVYCENRTKFLADVSEGGIEYLIASAFLKKTGKYASHSEQKSWRNSLDHMRKVLSDDSMPSDLGVGIEVGIPQSSKRIDFMLSGTGEGGEANLIIVELKQWSTSKFVEKDGLISANRGGKNVSEGAHPCYQAWSYAELLQGFSEPVYSDPIELHPCAYLHNHLADGQIDHPAYRPYIEKAPLFLKGESEQEKLRAFIRAHVRRGDEGKLLYRIVDGRIRPSKMLADALSGMLDGNREFILIDDQKVAFENCMAIARISAPANRNVIIVKGGPGTGKSVLAINLLSKILDERLNARYVSKNAAPRAVFKKRLRPGRTITAIDNLFSGSGSFYDTEADSFDVLIVDEAHRLNLKSGLYGNLGENQVKELMKSAPCCIFFADDDQVVTLQDVGNIANLRKWAMDLGANVLEMALESQFRCNGSDGYLAWLDNTLGIRSTATPSLDGIQYDFRVMESPEEMHEAIRALNKDTNRSRVVAGYCWNWKSKTRPELFDIEIPEFGYTKQWNLALHGSLWIVEPNSIDQVGCIHTCQGLELDYVGVIVGPDLVIRYGELCTVPEARSPQDRSIRGYRTLMREKPDETKHRVDRIIRNTYKTLMTRGMKGCFVFCTDPETREYFKNSIALRPIA